MKKNIILYSLIIFLIIVNGFFLFHFLRNPEMPMQRSGGENPENFILKELEFNANQKEHFIILSETHRNNMQSISEELKELKDLLFSKILEKSINSKEIDSITSLIGEKEKAIDMTTFNHFRVIQNMCNEKQKEKFERIIKDAIHRGNPQERPEGKDGPPPPRPQ